MSRITDLMYDTKPFMKYPILQVEVSGVVGISSVGSMGGRGAAVVRPFTVGELVVVVVDSIPQLPDIF